MDKADRKRIISAAMEGMILGQEIVERAENRRQQQLGEALFNAFYAVELLVKEPQGDR